jgi:YVTN family beta-propeller protein
MRFFTGLLAAALLVSATACAKSDRAAPMPADTPMASASLPSVTALPGPPNVYEHIRDVNQAVAGVPSRVYVPNSMSNTVDVIDPGTMQVIDHFAAGRLPQHVTPSWDLKRLYIDNDLGDSLTPIDPVTGKRGDKIYVLDPYNLYFTPDGRFAVVVAEKFRRLDFRDPHTFKLVKTVYIGHSGPNHLDFSPDGRYLIISCEFSGYVVKVDVERMEVITSVHVGGKPADVRISPDGKAFFVANEYRNGVSVIDPEKMVETKFIPTGHGAHGFVVARNGKDLYVTNRTGGSVSVLDMETQVALAKWITGGSPDMGGVSADGSKLWLSNRYGSSVMAIDTRSGSVLARIPVGRSPHGLCVYPQPGRYSLGHTGNFR